MKEEYSTIFEIFRYVQQRFDYLQNDLPKSAPVRERLAHQHQQKMELPWLKDLLMNSLDRLNTFKTIINEGEPFTFISPSEETYLNHLLADIAPDFVAAATFAKLKANAKIQKATNAKFGLISLAKPHTKTRHNKDMNNNIELIELMSESKGEYTHPYSQWADIYSTRARQLVKEAQEYADPAAYSMAKRAQMSAEFTKNTANAYTKRHSRNIEQMKKNYVLSDARSKKNISSYASNYDKEVKKDVGQDLGRTESLLYSTEILLFNLNPRHKIPSIYSPYVTTIPSIYSPHVMAENHYIPKSAKTRKLRK